MPAIEWLTNSVLAFVSEQVAARSLGHVLHDPVGGRVLHRASAEAMAAAIEQCAQPVAGAQPDLARATQVLDQVFATTMLPDGGPRSLLDRVEAHAAAVMTAAAAPVEVGPGFPPVSVLEALRIEAGMSFDPAEFGRVFVDAWVQAVRDRSVSAPVVAELANQLAHDLTGRAVRDLPGVLHRDDDERRADFERRYLRYAASDHATFELFQVAAGKAPVGFAFDDFYVTPSIARRQTADDQPDLTGAGTDPANAVAEARRVLLLGGAGAGKTTFLSWLAYLAATSSGHEGPWHQVVPFHVPLRRFADAALPANPERLLEATAPVLSGAAPQRWASDLFASGRALLLVDGLDELVAEHRDLAKRWLETFVRTYPDARYVVTTRPSAVDDTWFAEGRGRVGLTRFELLPLSRTSLNSVIENWYEAALTQERDPAQHDWLRGCKAGLQSGLATRPNLRTLVSSPLLAALLCVLYRQNNEYLPHTRRELLDQALDLLLVRWDDSKLQAGDAQHAVPVEDELQMTKAEQLILLERFAAPMVRNAELSVSEDNAIARLERAKAGLRSQQIAAARLLPHLLVRTGLLRSHSPDRTVEFVHRTFRDYLAAADMVKAGEIQHLVDNAHKDSWHEVVFMAVAQAREREVATLLRSLLARAAKEPEVADRLMLLAAACLGYAEVVDPDQVRIEVQRATGRLIPPASFNDAEMLARAGSFVVDLLPGAGEIAGRDRDEVAARVIRTLALVGGEEAWEKLRPFTAMHQSTVVEELLRGWRQVDFSDEYARVLLSQIDFGDRVLDVRRWALLPSLRRLRTLRAVRLIGDLPLADPRDRRHPYPLAEISRLRALDIVANEVVRDLDPLTRCRHLEVLRIEGYSTVRDLSALAATSVQELVLHPTGRTVSHAVADLATLSGAPLRRLSVRHPELATGLLALPGNLPLQELVVGNRAGTWSLRGIDRWPELTEVTVDGIPTDDDVAALARLPALRRLVVHHAEPTAGLARLAPLQDSLKVVDVHGGSLV